MGLVGPLKVGLKVEMKCFSFPKKGDKTDNTYLARLELICIMWFTVEYALRLAGAPEKWNFLKGLEISE
jgi:hypothetical protein